MFYEYIKYYYQALPQHKKDVYMQIYQGFRARKTTIDIHTDRSRISPDDLIEITTAVYNDTPSFYYLDMSGITWRPTSFGYEFGQKFIYSTSTIARYDEEVEKFLAKFKARYITPNMSDYEKEKAIHDYLVKNVTYNHRALSLSPRIHEAFNIIGPLLRGTGVCWGISCAFKLMCDYLRIKCFVVIGNTLPVQPGGAGHAWNMVRIDGQSYHVDATWDTKEKGDISFCYDYFNLSDRLIKFDHTWESTLYPTCSSIENNYYKKHHLYVRTIPELTRFIADQISSGNRYIAVKFANDMPPKPRIVEAMQEAMAQARYYSGCSYVIAETTNNIYIQL